MAQRIIEKQFHKKISKDFSPRESIKWGARWLYHKAQGITNTGERYWRPWNEAVQNYNYEGNPKYEKEVYDVYERGIDKRG